MAYHITQVVNNSNATVALVNPAWGNDAALIASGATYNPSRPVLINNVNGESTYKANLGTAVNFYTSKEDYCIWDNGNDAINGIGQFDDQATNFRNHSAGDVQVVVNNDGTLAINMM